MKLKRLIAGLSRNRRGLALLAGVTAVLEGVEWVMSTRAPAKPAVVAPLKPKRVDYFSIRQTRSELGFVLWVLQGHGCYQSFSLFDTWQEAVEEANQRLAVLKPERYEFAHV